MSDDQKPNADQKNATGMTVWDVVWLSIKSKGVWIFLATLLFVIVVLIFLESFYDLISVTYDAKGLHARLGLDMDKLREVANNKAKHDLEVAQEIEASNRTQAIAKIVLGRWAARWTEDNSSGLPENEGVLDLRNFSCSWKTDTAMAIELQPPFDIAGSSGPGSAVVKYHRGNVIFREGDSVVKQVPIWLRAKCHQRASLGTDGTSDWTDEFFVRYEIDPFKVSLRLDLYQTNCSLNCNKPSKTVQILPNGQLSYPLDTGNVRMVREK